MKNVLSFEDGLELLKGKAQKKLENNTYLVKVDEDTIGVKLHVTIVVYIFRSGRYKLDSGGWRSMTTKDRMNKYSPVNVCQKNHVWYIEDDIFDDGVHIDSSGNVLTPLRGANERAFNEKRLKRLVRNYINGFANHIVANGLVTRLGDGNLSPWSVVKLGQNVQKPLSPSSEDCWACHFGINSDEHLKEPLGVDHLLKHMTDDDGPYYVPSLLWKAIVTKGYRAPLAIWHVIDHEAKRGESEMSKLVLNDYFNDRKTLLLDRMDLVLR